MTERELLTRFLDYIYYITDKSTQYTAISAFLVEGKPGKGQPEMNWTTEYPTQTGYYWLRNARYQAGGYECMPMSAQIVEVRQFQYTDDDGIRIKFIGESAPLSRKDFNQAEWLGPIMPPQENEK